MTEQVTTTKPGDKYASIQNPRQYRALRRRGYSKTQAARISNGRMAGHTVKAERYGGTKRADLADSSFVFPDTRTFPIKTAGDVHSAVSSWGRYRGPHSFAEFKRKLTALAKRLGLADALPAAWSEQTIKAPNYGARAGQTIAGRLVRGADGKFHASGAPEAAKPAKPAGSARRAARRGRKPAKPKQTPEQRQAARDATHSATRDKNRQAVIDAMANADSGLSPSGSKALLAMADGGDAGALTDNLVQMGLVERGVDGTPRLTSDGRTAVAGMNAGDVRRATDAITQGGQRAAQHTERQQAQAQHAQERTARQQAAEAKRQEREQARLNKPAKGGGGGGKAPKTPAPRSSGGSTSSRPSGGGASSASSAAGRGASQAAAGAAAAQRAQAQRQQQAAQAARQAQQQQAQVERARVTTPELADAARQLSDGQSLDPATATALVRNGLARQDSAGNLTLTSTGLRATRQKAAPAFAVFKDASGQWRWIGLSSNAYRDRDGEIVSTKALADDCARADTDGSYGPLRWWHMPGVDIGDCDFNAMSGRVLVEMGTFRNASVAQAVKDAAGELQLSIGFYHPASEPDAAGVFHHIARFERSLVPRGRAANPFTRLMLVKETPAMLEEKVKEALSKLGTLPEARAYMEQIISAARATEKAADDQGVAFKAPDPEPPTDPIAARLAALEAEIASLKATAAPPATDEEAPVEVELQADGMDAMDEGADDGSMFNDAERQEIQQLCYQACSQACQEMAAQIMGALDLEKKVAGHVSTLMAPYQAQKDDADAQQAAELAALKTGLETTKAQLATLTGEQPRATKAAPFRITDNPTVTPERRKELGAPGPDPQRQPGPFDDMFEKLFTTTNGVVGN